jgi:uncharacterized repeat protein (TIGR01451 family)
MMSALRTVLVGLLASAVLATAAPARASDGQESLVVTVSRPQIAVALGDRLTFQSTVTNSGSTTASGLVAHLNVLSLHPGVYVDPEDWASARTRYLDPLPPGGSKTISWNMQAVSSGSFGVYVAVLPERVQASPPTTSPTVELTVRSRETLNSSGILPLALGMPALLGALLLGIRLRASDRRPSFLRRSSREPVAR